MKKIVNCCSNCPFYHIEYDYESVGKNEFDMCILSQYMNPNNIYYVDLDENPIFHTPEWCPIKNEEYNISFKEFSDKRKNEIIEINKKIAEQFEIYEHYEEDIEDVQNITFDYDSHNKKTNELYNELNKLMNSDDYSTYDENIKVELNDSIDQIKKQLITLENLGNKLNDELNNLGKLD